MHVLKLAIVDTGLGNLKSIEHSLTRVGGIDAFVSSDAKEIETANVVILPGVGAFDEFMKRLKLLNLINVLNEKALQEKIPLLGVCVGMQAFFEKSSEGCGANGLGWMEGQVERMEKKEGITIPHIGWNNVDFVNSQDPMCKGFPNSTDFYFLHSYVVTCPSHLAIAHCNYGQTINSIVRKENIIGVQFHPEKSYTQGVKLITNFIDDARAKHHAEA